ncbi:hypothetical protein [Saccharospirillum salsuginis]|nr:hypothetical protein [Saccharospirillum salsuginis]
MKESDRDVLPSHTSLLKATLGALLIGAILLVTAVMPAEFGVDPTGLGGVMGFDRLHSEADTTEASNDTGTGSASLMGGMEPPVWRGNQPHRSDRMSLTLAPGEGAEIKAQMAEGDRFVFNWRAEGGTVTFDMHGEPPNAGDEFTSYWVGRDQTTASGTFEAPFEGTHGWFWVNRGREPVTVSVETSGFYQSLFKP